MIYTGNNGRMYIARSRTSGLTGSFPATVPNGVAVALNQTFMVRSISGGGRGATVKASSAVTSGQPSRGCTFTVDSAGSGYKAGDTVKFYYIDRNNVAIDVSDTRTVSTVTTLGVDNEREILEEQYRIAKIRSWSLTSNSEVVETTALGDTTKTYAPSVTSGEGSATLMFYEDDSANTGSNQQKDIFELVDILFPRSTPPRVILNLAVDGSVNGASGQVGGNALWKTNFLFNAYITSASVGASYGEVVAVETSFTVDGPLLDVPWKTGVARL